MSALCFGKTVTQASAEYRRVKGIEALASGFPRCVAQLPRLRSSCSVRLVRHRVLTRFSDNEVPPPLASKKATEGTPEKVGASGNHPLPEDHSDDHVTIDFATLRAPLEGPRPAHLVVQNPLQPAPLMLHNSSFDSLTSKDSQGSTSPTRPVESPEAPTRATTATTPAPGVSEWQRAQAGYAEGDDPFQSLEIDSELSLRTPTNSKPSAAGQDQKGRDSIPGKTGEQEETEYDADVSEGDGHEVVDARRTVVDMLTHPKEAVEHLIEEAKRHGQGKNDGVSGGILPQYVEAVFYAATHFDIGTPQHQHAREEQEKHQQQIRNRGGSPPLRPTPGGAKTSDLPSHLQGEKAEEQ